MFIIFTLILGICAFDYHDILDIFICLLLIVMMFIYFH